MFITPSFKKSLIVDQFQGNYLKGKWYMRRFDPDTVQNGHIYSSIKEEEVFIYRVYFGIFCGLG